MTRNRLVNLTKIGAFLTGKIYPITLFLCLSKKVIFNEWVSLRIEKGCPPHKLILGLPAFGRTFTLANRRETGLSARSFSNNTLSGNFTKTPGFLSYYEICELKKKQPNVWKNVWISQSKSNYMYSNNDWISYDDMKSFHLRVSISCLFNNANKPQAS
jgi:GH18 family chitinase